MLTQTPRGVLDLIDVPDKLVTFRLDPQLHELFKEACVKANKTMTEVLTDFIIEYTNPAQSHER